MKRFVILFVGTSIVAQILVALIVALITAPLQRFGVDTRVVTAILVILAEFPAAVCAGIISNAIEIYRANKEFDNHFARVTEQINNRRK